MTDLNLVFGSLADPTRREILGLLRESGELRVGDIAEAFAMSLNGVSKHLKVLEQAGVLVRRVEGRNHWIRVNENALQHALEWLSEQHRFWAARRERIGKLAENASRNTSEKQAERKTKKGRKS